ncbi:MAG TPA: trypsin-like peptidase domain-containing protein [Acidimicrobiales bacterium]|nr:trypsin-like peptidase domain-containing protein [Acidimicrobiales bacterium]
MSEDAPTPAPQGDPEYLQGNEPEKTVSESAGPADASAGAVHPDPGTAANPLGSGPEPADTSQIPAFGGGDTATYPATGPVSHGAGAGAASGPGIGQGAGVGSRPGDEAGEPTYPPPAAAPGWGHPGWQAPPSPPQGVHHQGYAGQGYGSSGPYGQSGASGGYGQGYAGYGYPPGPGYPGHEQTAGGPGHGYGAPQQPQAPYGQGWAPGATGWGTPPQHPWGPPPNQPSRRPDRGVRVAVGVVAALVVALSGFAVGRVFSNSSNTSSNGSSASPSFGGSFTTPNGGQSNGGAGNGFSNGSGGTGSSSGSGNGSNALSSNVAAKVDPGVVDITTVLGYQNGAAAGTGMVLTSDGLVLTNNHVVAQSTSIKATDVGNGQTYTATVVGTDVSADVAVVQLQGASGLKTVNIGQSSSVSTGDTIIAIGNAGGVGGTPSVTSGQVTALDQSITASDESDGSSEQLSGLIQTNADLQPGDSGGPLVNSAGQVVGMDTAASSGFSFSSSSNEGFAIPIDTAISIAKQMEAGKASSTIHIGPAGFLGVGVVPAGQSSFGLGGSSSSGAEVQQVQPGSPAEGAGIQVGDVIDSLDGQTVDSPSTLTTLMQEHHPGDQVDVGWTDSNGVQHSAEVTLATGPTA